MTLAAFVLPTAALGQTICNTKATGPQPYSLVPGGDGTPVYIPGGLNEFLGYIPQPFVALPGEPTVALAFCGPAWQASYTYTVGNMIQLSNGIVMQAVGCKGGTTTCMSGASPPAGFSGPLFDPSPVGLWVGTCSDSGSIATCETVSATGTSAPVNPGEPYKGADVGSTMVISNYSVDPSYSGAWTVTTSTNTDPYTFSFTASGLGSGDCTSLVGALECVSYQRGTQVKDNEITWQDVGPQNETTLLTPVVTVVPASFSITTSESLSVTTTVGGGTGHPTPTGTVVLSGGSYSSGKTTLSGGSVMITIPAGSLPGGTDTLTGTYSGDGTYDPATGFSSVTVSSSGPGFTITGTSVSIPPGATTGNTSTITVTPVNGFTGSVTLTAAVTSSPTGAQDLPTFSFGSTSPVVITSGPGTATLTISTTAPATAVLTYQNQPDSRWHVNVGVVVLSGVAPILALLLVGTNRSLVRMQASNWRVRVTLATVGLALAGGFLSCGGISSSSSSSGTTPGSYTVTVTGTSGSTTGSGTVSLTVQ